MAIGISLGGWGSGYVGASPSHVAHWDTGNYYEPIRVKRDNPNFEGWFWVDDGAWSEATGAYSHVYDWSCFGDLVTYEFVGPGADPYGSIPGSMPDDWTTKLRPIPGSQYIEDPEGGWLNFAVRSGNLIPGNHYGLAQVNMCNGHSPSTKWYKLADDVLVVPVIVFSWDNSADDGPAYDFRAKARALFDFIPFWGSITNTVPAGWNPQASDNPVGLWLPPDDIFTACGIQLQVVRTFKFRRQYQPPLPICDPDPTRRNFADDQIRLEKVAAQLTQEAGGNAVVGTVLAHQLLELLDPMLVDIGRLACYGYKGKADPAAGIVEIDREASSCDNLVAHELGHVFYGGGHVSDPIKLMHATNCSAVVIDNCDAARQVAAPYDQRYRQFNATIGRLPKSNPAAPAYPAPGAGDPMNVSLAQSCCEWSGSLGWLPLGTCVGIGGTKKPDNQCTDCCLLSADPPDVAFVRLGSCGGTVLQEKAQCSEACCQIGGQFQKLPQYECAGLGGSIVSQGLCGRPR